MPHNMKTDKYIISLLSVWTLLSFSMETGAQPLSSGDSLSFSGGRPVLNLTLEQCRDMALRNSASVLNADLDVQAAIAQKREAFAGYFPKVSANAMAFYAFDPMLELGLTDILGDSPFVRNLNDMLSSYAQQFGFSTVYSTLKKGVAAKISVTQPLFAGGRIVTGNRLAGLGYQAAGLQKDIVLRNSAEEIERNYWQVISLEEKMRTTDEACILLDTLYRDVLSASGAGLAVDTDLMQVKMKMNSLKTDRIRLRNGIRLSKMNLLNTIGVEYNPYSAFGNDSIPYIDDVFLTDSLPEMQGPEHYYRAAEDAAMEQEESRLLDISVESKRLEKRMALGEALPQVMVGASYGYSNIIDEGAMNGAVFGMVRIPITDWGKTSRKMQKIDAQMQKAENDRSEMQRKIVLQIHRLWMEATASWEQLQVAMENVSLAETLQDRMYAKYMAGMAAMSDLLQAQTELSEAEAELTDKKIAYRMALRAYMDRVE